MVGENCHNVYKYKFFFQPVPETVQVSLKVSLASRCQLSFHFESDINCIVGLSALLRPRTNFPQVLEQREDCRPAEEKHEESNFVLMKNFVRLLMFSQ